MTTNPREEIELTFNGRAFRVRPTFKNIVNLEGALAQPARAVGMKALAAGTAMAERGMMPEIMLTELAVVIFWMLNGQEGAPKSPEEVGDILMEDGYSSLLQPVGEYLTRAQRGHKIHVKEAEEADKAKEAAAASGEPGPTTDA